MRRSAHTRRSTPILAVLAAIAAGASTMASCADGGSRASSHTVTDSAGIQVVHSHRPAWGEGEAWRVEPEPRLEIGAVAGEDAYILDRVMGIAVLDDGGVALAHMGDNTVRFYDAAGRFVRRVGGSGEGPEEFTQIMDIDRFGDELWARNSRFNYRVYDPEGRLLRSRDIPLEPPPDFRYVFVRGAFADGSLVMGDWPQGSPKRPEPVVDSASLLRYAGDGRWDTLAHSPAARMLPVEGHRFSTSQEFGPTLSVGIGQDRLYHGFPERYEIVVRDTTGDVVRILRRSPEPRPVTQAHIDAHREEYLGWEGDALHPVSPRLREQRRNILDSQIYPEHHPAYGRLIEDRAGNLWVERPDPDHPPVTEGWLPVRDVPTPWDVFDPDGVWLGTVEFPARFHVHEIGEDYVAGVWKDEMEVEFVRVYGLES